WRIDMAHSGFWRELTRRNVLRAGVLYIGASWALAQGIAQLTPAIGLPDFAIIGVLVVAVMLLGSGYFIRRQAPAVAPALASVIPAKSIAVLPLVNESSDKNQQYFSDGLSEEMISALGQVHDLKVIGRNSSFQFRGDAQNDSAGIGA